MEHIKFFLRPNSNKEIGTLSHYILEGQTVKERKSYKIKVPIKQWDKKIGRVKKSNPEYFQINRMLDEITNRFNFQITLGNKDPEKQCLILCFEKFINSKIDLSYGSRTKYKIISNNLKSVARDLYGNEYLPMGYFRDIDKVNQIRHAIRKSRKSNGNKSNSALKNYLGRICAVIQNWNETSGTSSAINIAPIMSSIAKDEEKISRALSIDELELLSNYQTGGYRGGQVENTAQSIFLFQLHSRGTRIQDAMLVTNKNYSKGEMKIRNRKTKKTVTLEPSYELASSLKTLFPLEFQYAERFVTLADFELDLEDANVFARLEFPQSLQSWDISDFNKIELLIKMENEHYYKNNVEVFDKVGGLLEQRIAHVFFEKLSTKDETFLFPYLSYDDFAVTSLEYDKFIEPLEIKIQRARAKHNNALIRICTKLKIEKVSGHTPRHTIARILYQAGAPETFIRDILGHADLKTTQHYLNTRHVRKTISNSQIGQFMPFGRRYSKN